MGIIMSASSIVMMTMQLYIELFVPNVQLSARKFRNRPPKHKSTTVFCYMKDALLYTSLSTRAPRAG